jgi:hypothetical protein
MSLKAYNFSQIKELHRIRGEVKWLIGEQLGFDPSTTPEGRALVEDAFSKVILERGAGEWLAGDQERAKIRMIITGCNNNNENN